MAAPIALSISVALVSIIALGVHDILTNYESNGCEMTYMFERPQYMKLDLGVAAQSFPGYGLYIYGEGSYANKIRNLKLNGIPVLFIPGNSGSHKQVRSLGSVALRMSEMQHTKVHFNYFVVGIDEELSGLYGGVLPRQTEFVHLCIQKILTFYREARHRPTSVALVGHSMGGIVARGLFTLPDFNPVLVSTILTQATPHRKPVVSLDPELHNYYKSVNSYWSSGEGREKLRHVTVVSTGGGHRDFQVRSALTQLDGIVADDRGLSAVTTAIPKSWVSTDHQCAVWCRQMVLLTQRALFDVVDYETMQISQDADKRMDVFRHHFLSSNALPNYLSNVNNSVTLDPSVKWEIKVERQWTFQSRKTTTDKYIAVPLNVEEKSDSILVKSNLTNPEWICYCDIPKGQNSCTTCITLSSSSRLLPPLYSNTKFVGIHFKDINYTNDTHIVIRIPAGQKKVSISSDRYNSDERHLVYHLPSSWDSIISYPISATDGAAMLKISNESSFYSLHLAGLALPTTAYKAQVVPQGCRRHSAEDNEGSVLRLNVPWSNEETYSFARYGKPVSLMIKLQTPRPPAFSWDWHLEDASEPHLEMFLHPYCHYQLRLLASPADSLGQGVRFYAGLGPAFAVAVLLMALGGVLLTESKGQLSSSPQEAVLRHSQPHYLALVVLVIRTFVGFGPIRRLLTQKLSIPVDDTHVLEQEGVYFLLLPGLLYICACAVIYLQTFIVYHFLWLLSYGGRLLSWMPRFLYQVRILLVLVIVTALALTFLCGSLGLLFSAGVLILKVLYLTYLMGRGLDTRDTHTRLAVTFPVMLLVNLQAMFSLGALVVWLKTIKSNNTIPTSLSPDPSRLPGLVTVVSVGLLVFFDKSSTSRFSLRLCSWSLYAMATVSILYASDSLHRLPYIMSLAVLVTCLPSLLAVLSSWRWKTEDVKKE